MPPRRSSHQVLSAARFSFGQETDEDINQIVFIASHRIPLQRTAKREK